MPMTPAPSTRFGEKQLFPLVMAFLMALMMSAVFTVIGAESDSGFLMAWAHKFLMAWPAASIAVFIALPVARRLTHVIAVALHLA